MDALRKSVSGKSDEDDVPSPKRVASKFSDKKADPKRGLSLIKAHQKSQHTTQGQLTSGNLRRGRKLMTTKKTSARNVKAATKKVAAPKRTAAKSTKPAKKTVGSASDTVDEQLARYRSMRDFHVTAEPSGGHKSSKPRPTGALPFVIQKHAASHLHYDFRLGWNGVLKSWAVTKGPSYYPGDRRLAVQVEDHPMEYGGFEGVIPKGQYGGGTVMVWDQGTWTPQPGYENADAGLRDGSLKFVMHGTKMKGKWTLVRMGGKAANESKPNWLLIKEHDDFERGKDDPCIIDGSQIPR